VFGGAAVVRSVAAGALVVTLACTDSVRHQGDRCDDTDSAACVMQTVPRSERGNYGLVVSNQSFEVPSVSISVTIDDRSAAVGRFDVGNQHNWVNHHLRVTDGTHRLTAEATDLEGNRLAGLEETLSVRGRQFGLVTFWTEAGEHQLRFEASEEPFAFG
jgi:hypothetical protein